MWKPLLVVVLSCSSCASADDGGSGDVDTGTPAIDSSTVDSARADTAIGADSDRETAVVDSSSGDTTTIDAPVETRADGSADATDAIDAPTDTSPGALRIDEIYVDRDLSGDAVEFVEIAGPTDASLDGLHLRLIDAAGTVKYDVAITTGAKIGSSGRWVVGGNRTDTYFTGRLDQSVGIASWGLDNTAGAVQLVSGTTLVDVIGYGAKVAGPSTPPTATYETDAATLPSSAKQSLARKGGLDTGNNVTDLCAQNGTPGSAGGACL
jgi:hypothetical protein